MSVIQTGDITPRPPESDGLNRTLAAAQEILPLLHQIKNIWNRDGGTRSVTWARNIFVGSETLSTTLDQLIRRWNSTLQVWSKKEETPNCNVGVFNEVKAILESHKLTPQQMLQCTQAIEEHYG